jgi:anthranilate/para-aminobenzoate synthase component I
LQFQTGGGIVTDSAEEAEYLKTLNKAAAIYEVLQGIACARY